MVKRFFKSVGISIALMTAAPMGEGLAASQHQEKSADEAFLVHRRLDGAQQKVGVLVNRNRTVMGEFDRLASLLKESMEEKSLSKEAVMKIVDAIEFAAEKHKGQTRKNKERTPYIAHPLAVANALMEIGKVRDQEVIVAGLLHDTLTDTKTTDGEIEKRFGRTVAKIVREGSSEKGGSSAEWKRRQVILAPKWSDGVAMIKMCDQIYNLDNLLYDAPAHWNRQRVDDYFHWTQAVLERLPMANELLRSAVEKRISQYWDQQ